MELFVFLIVVFFGLGYLARTQVGARSQRERDRIEAGRPIGYGASVAPPGTSRGASVQAPFFGSEQAGQSTRSHGADE